MNYNKLYAKFDELVYNALTGRTPGAITMDQLDNMKGLKMSISIEQLLKNIDWPLLRRQKMLLYSLVEANTPLDRLVSFIDALQDAVVSEGIATEAEVFGELEDE